MVVKALQPGAHSPGAFGTATVDLAITKPRIQPAEEPETPSVKDQYGRVAGDMEISALTAVKETAEDRPLDPVTSKLPTFVGIGMGPTGMMGMLSALSEGQRAIGVELRGDPERRLHWNVRADFFHSLKLIDEEMETRYPGRQPFSLADMAYKPEQKSYGKTFDKLAPNTNLFGRVSRFEFIDARAGSEKVTKLEKPVAPDVGDPSKIRGAAEMLASPSTFQVEAKALEEMLRRYLEGIEKMDREAGIDPPRVTLYKNHRVAIPLPTDNGEEAQGWLRQPDGSYRIILEQVQETRVPGQRAKRERVPGSPRVDLGVPDLFFHTGGASAPQESDLRRLGYVTREVQYDDLPGHEGVPTGAQADFIAANLGVFLDGTHRRRISSVYDENGQEHWVRQIAVGHENHPQVGWTLVQVPDFMKFDPVEAGILPKDIDPASQEYRDAAQEMIYKYYLEQASLILDVPAERLRNVPTQPSPPVLFTLRERIGDHARLAKNGIVGGDAMGNGHFLTSGGAMTGGVAHSACLRHYFQSLRNGVDSDTAFNTLCDDIKASTEAWLAVSKSEFTSPAPVNFGEAARVAIFGQEGPKKNDGHVVGKGAEERVDRGLAPLSADAWRGGVSAGTPLAERIHDVMG